MKILDCTDGDIFGERGARGYNAGLGQSPQRGPGAETLVRGSNPPPPPEADSILAFERLYFAMSVHCATVIMRPSSLGGGRILRRTLSVRLSVCLSVRPSRYRCHR